MPAGPVMALKATTLKPGNVCAMVGACSPPSVGPPAANGTMILTGLEGKSAASCAAGRPASATARSSRLAPVMSSSVSGDPFSPFKPVSFV
jgi:hypothetical protein